MLTDCFLSVSFTYSCSYLYFLKAVSHIKGLHKMQAPFHRQILKGCGCILPIASHHKVYCICLSYYMLRWVNWIRQVQASSFLYIVPHHNNIECSIFFSVNLPAPNGKFIGNLVRLPNSSLQSIHNFAFSPAKYENACSLVSLQREYFVKLLDF